MLALGCDHGGYPLMKEVIKYLEDNKIAFKNFGTYSEASVDYPEYAKKVAHAVADGECEKGILICGTGIGMCITANKFPGIRAAVGHDCFSAERSILSNNGNVLCFGARVIGPELAKKILREWITLEFQDGSSTPKVQAILDIERENMK